MVQRNDALKYIDEGIEKKLDKCIDRIIALNEEKTVQSDPIGSIKELEKITTELKTANANLRAFLLQRRKLDLIFLKVNLGVLLDEILETVYSEFHELLPFNRIGLSLVAEDGHTLEAYWAKSDRPIMKLGKGYFADLRKSSLKNVSKLNEPRIINDLEEYLAGNPKSESTRLMVEEGMRSSLTCPLIVNGAPIGFIFFSSITPHAYYEYHTEIFNRIAARLAVIVERGRLAGLLNEQRSKMQTQNAELKRLSDLKNTFLGIAAHDLRNPLANIQMITSLLLSDPVTLTAEESMDLINEIRIQTSTMLELIGNILDVTQIESGKLSLNPRLEKLDEFLKEIVHRHNHLAEPKQTHIVLEKIPSGRIYADPFRLRQVFDNLISNAVKFSPPKTVVTVRAIRRKDGWKFEVSDQGPGINDKDLEKVFGDFVRLSNKPTGGEKSTGLGLAIAKRVVEAHKGRIGVVSAAGKGSTFWFFMPDMTEN